MSGNDRVIKAVIDGDTDGIFKGSAHEIHPDLPPPAQPSSADEPTKAEE